MTNTNLIKDIVEGILEFKVIPFFGAGMSVPFGFKDWDELINELQQELGSEESDNLKVAQQYEDGFGRSALVEKLRNNYSIQHIEELPTENHQLILSMGAPIIYTTNYDEGIERTAKLINRDYYKVAGLNDIVNMPQGANIVVKFHGDFSAEEEIVLTENDFNRRMEAENALDVLLRSHMLGKSFFFMGYGLRDKNIDFLFRRHSELYGRENLPTSYIVVFKDSYDPYRIEALAEKNITSIILESPAELASILKEINQEVYKWDFATQSERMFQSLPMELLLESDADNLEQFLKSDEYSDMMKADKLEATLSHTQIPAPLQPRVIGAVTGIVANDGFGDEAMDVVLRTVFWANLDPKESIMLGVELVALTERKEYQRSLNNFKLLDPMQCVQKKFKDVGAVLCILLYLVRGRENSSKLEEDQLHLLKYVLQACKYDKHDFGDMLSREEMDALLSYFYTDYTRWTTEPSHGTRRSMNYHFESMVKSFLKELGGRL